MTLDAATSSRLPVFVVAMCGASGAIYGLQLLKALLERPCRVLCVISRAGYQVLEHETGFCRESGSFTDFLKFRGVKFHPDARFDLFGPDDVGAPPASGSFRHSGMVVAPCSMKTLAAIASGMADTLITRAADVALKEKRPLILLPRETPLNLIHLENMVRACRAGATIMPPSPSFYSGASGADGLADTVVARVLDHLGLDHDLVPRWGEDSL
ncbi:MAG: flavin prenyltransferase UbiX [Pseudomonadota bacterium]